MKWKNGNNQNKDVELKMVKSNIKEIHETLRTMLSYAMEVGEWGGIPQSAIK